MGSRPLRQYYDGVSISVDDDLPLVESWVRHRRRLAAAVTGLADEQWTAPTRCTDWDARGVVSHLVTVDGFWTSSLRSALGRVEPTTFIRGFDPSTGTDAFVAPMLELPTDAIVEAFLASTGDLVAAVESFGGDDWSSPGEAPFGHLPAKLLLAHAYWDSWLHERDILLPLGAAGPVDPDDLLVATWYTLVVGALQGGLVGDPAPVGPGPERPIDVTLRFADLPDDALRVEIDRGVSIRRTASTEGSVVAALDVVEEVTGRVQGGAVAALPPELAAQLGRARADPLSAYSQIR